MLFYGNQRQSMGKSWQEWPELLRNRNFEALARQIETPRWHFILCAESVSRENLKTVCKCKRCADCRRYSNLCSFDSADAWAHQEYFIWYGWTSNSRWQDALPDAFCSLQGNCGENPTYRWNILADQRLFWWLERLSMSELFDYVRIDHFRALKATMPFLPKTKNSRKRLLASRPREKTL